MRHRELGHHGMSHNREEKDDSKEGIPIPPSKPKIWSMAEMAVCKTPPPGGQHWNYPGSVEPGLARQHPAMTAAALRSDIAITLKTFVQLRVYLTNETYSFSGRTCSGSGEARRPRS